MTKNIQKLLKSIFRSFGLDVKRRSIATSSELRLIKLMADYDINLVYDIGANEGQFSQELLAYGFKGTVVSFEPLSSAHILLFNKSTDFDNWIVESRCAIGDGEYETEINISASSASSSLLKMAKSHISAAPYTEMISSESVCVKRMDSFFETYGCENKNLFIKIDTQGFEYQVLKGGLNTLNAAKILQLEVSLVELYEGQVLMKELFLFIESLGFTLWGLEPAFVDNNTARMLQVDAIFIRNV
jgi:FkbM family methyltransferase